MKKTMNLLLFVVLIGTLSECKKGEDDPFISLRRRKARVVGDWKLTSGTTSSSYSNNYGNSTNSGTDSYNYTESTFSYNGSDTYNGNTNSYSDAGIYSYDLVFKKDGTYSLTENEDGIIRLESGVWNFTHGVGEYKNKEQIALTERMVVNGSNSSVYTGREPDRTITLKELRNKKMVIAWDNTSSNSGVSGSSSSSTSNTSKGELILEQK